VADVDLETVYIAVAGYQIFPDPSRIQVGDHDGDGVADLMVKLDRQAITDLLAPGEEAFVGVGGLLVDGAAFAGYDALRVVSPGK
jgi:hypothetical protein